MTNNLYNIFQEFMNMYNLHELLEIPEIPEITEITEFSNDLVDTLHELETIYESSSDTDSQSDINTDDDYYNIFRGQYLKQKLLTRKYVQARRHQRRGMFFVSNIETLETMYEV